MVYSNIFIMRLYLEHISRNIKTLDSLEPYKRQQHNITMLYSDEGIYTVSNNNIKKHIIYDIPIQDYSFKNKIYFVDRSTIEYKTVNKIPFNHKIVKKLCTYYSIDPKSKLKFIIEESNNKIIDMYFETYEDINNQLILNDITTLVSCLN